MTKPTNLLNFGQKPEAVKFHEKEHISTCEAKYSEYSHGFSSRMFTSPQSTRPRLDARKGKVGGRWCGENEANAASARTEGRVSCKPEDLFGPRHTLTRTS